MLVALSDTHCREKPELTPHLRETIQDADLVAHAGDFTTEPVLDEFQRITRQFYGVQGNRDRAGVRSRLEETTVIDHLDRRFVIVHGHRHDENSLSLLARQEKADVVIVGHSHRPLIQSLKHCLLVNPGSHADPRGYQAGYAKVEQTDEDVGVVLRTVDGRSFQSARF